MNTKDVIKLSWKNFLFWLSRKINYPLLPPDAVQVNFTFRCNLSCKMCSMNEQMKFLEERGRQTEIDSQTFKKIIRETKDIGTKAVLFIGGEPLLRKDIFDLTLHAKKLGLGTVIVTNGVLLNEDNIERCFLSGVDWLSISLDAASEARFSAIRGERFFGKITDNIKKLNGLKIEKKKEFPKMIAVCTIMNDNLEELMDLVHLAEGLRIERIIFQPVVANNADQTLRVENFSGFVPAQRLAILDEEIDNLIKYKKASPENFDFIANSLRHLELIKRYFRGNVKPKDLPCYAGYNRLQVIQEGKVYFCVTQQKNEATFGDVKKNSLRDLWFSRDATAYRRSIRKCKYPCLQWCSYRDGFFDLIGFFQKKLLFKNNPS